MTQFTAVQFGFKEAARNYERMGARAIDVSEVLDELVDDITEIEEIIFNSEGRRGGGMWRRPTPAWRRRKDDPRTLHHSRALRRSVTYRGDPNNLVKIDGRQGVLIFGSKLPYALVHQRGSKPRGGGFFIKGGGRAGPNIRTPQRKFIKFTKGDRQRFSKKIAKYLAFEFKGQARKR